MGKAEEAKPRKEGKGLLRLLTRQGKGFYLVSDLTSTKTEDEGDSN